MRGLLPTLCTLVPSFTSLVSGRGLLVLSVGSLVAGLGAPIPDVAGEVVSLWRPVDLADRNILFLHTTIMSLF